MSPKQAILLTAFRKDIRLTLAQCVQLVGKNIYANREHYVREILNRMIERGWVIREKPGHYALNEKPSGAPKIDSIPCVGGKEAVMPAMREWARKNGLID